MALFLPYALLALFMRPSCDQEIGKSSQEQVCMSLSLILVSARSNREPLPQAAQSNTTKFSQCKPRRSRCSWRLLHSGPSMPAGNTEEKDLGDTSMIRLSWGRKLRGRRKAEVISGLGIPANSLDNMEDLTLKNIQVG